MDAETTKLYHRFRAAGMGGIVGEAAIGALEAARTLRAFRQLEDKGRVRIVAEDERESYWSVYGVPDDPKEKAQLEHYLDLWGCCCVSAQVRCPACGQWEWADSIGMCVYERPTDPFDNDYVISLMAAAVAAA